jgi:hypothetical protein
MANWEAISNNIINISQVLADFLDTANSKNVEWVYMQDDGTVKTIEVPNLGSAIKTLKDTAITPDELTEKLKDYYSKVDVDNIQLWMWERCISYKGKKSEIDNFCLFGEHLPIFAC